jgi:iron(III) transport system permease protein
VNAITQGKLHSTRLPSARTLIIGAAITVFVTFCILPIIYMLGISLIDAGGNLSVENYRRLFAEQRQQQLLISSVLLAFGTAGLATVIGAPLGLLLARADLPVRRLLRFLLIVPFVIPPYILALAWIYIGNSTGLLAEWLGKDLFSNITYSLTGAIIVLSISFYPLAMLATEAAARRVDSRLEEAALLVAKPGRVIWKITLPLIAPTILASTLIIFVLAISEFGVPGLLRVRVFTTEVFTAFAALYDFGAATALAAPLLVITLLAGGMAKLVIGERLLTTQRSFYTGLTLQLSRWRLPIIIGIVVVIISFTASPIIVLAIEAGKLERIASAVKASSTAITNSLGLSIIGASLIVIVGAMLGYSRARARTKLAGLVDLMFIVIFAVPSTVVGVGLIELWNRPGMLGTIYISPAIIVIAYMARFLSVAALILAASVRQVPVSFEEAAKVAGASWPRIFTRIVLPQIRTGIAASWVVIFVFTFGELGATVLVAPPGESTLPVRVYTLITNAPSSQVAALALIQTSIILIPLALLGIFVHSKGEDR